MRLIELDPRWAMDADIVVGGGAPVHDENRHGMAITFACPCCRSTERATRLAVFFANPIDGKPPSDDCKLWQRQGDTFETLTLSPSIDASAHAHWHGWITNGEVT